MTQADPHGPFRIEGEPEPALKMLMQLDPEAVAEVESVGPIVKLEAEHLKAGQAQYEARKAHEAAIRATRDPETDTAVRSAAEARERERVIWIRAAARHLIARQAQREAEHEAEDNGS